MNKKLLECRMEYEAKQAPTELKERISRIMKQNTHKRIYASTAAAAAIVCGLFIGSLNAFPSFAQNLASVPALAPMVRVLTFDRFEFSDSNFEAKVVTPKIEGLLDKDLQDKLNTDFKENANAVIAAFEKDYKELKAEYPDAHMGIEYNYLVKTDNEQYLALDVYRLEAVGSSSTTHKFFTFDKKAGTMVTLPSLFKDNADYVTPISAYLKEEMKRQNEAGENMFWIEGDEYIEPFTSIKPDQNFYLNADGNLVICFDKYEVGPGASGSPEFVIPSPVIKDIKK